MEMETIRNVLLKAFLINFVILIIVVVIGLIWGLDALLACFMKDIATAEISLLLWQSIAVYKIGNILLFLVPALAIHWELKCKKKKK